MQCIPKVNLVNILQNGEPLFGLSPVSQFCKFGTIWNDELGICSDPLAINVISGRCLILAYAQSTQHFYAPIKWDITMSLLNAGWKN